MTNEAFEKLAEAIRSRVAAQGFMRLVDAELNIAASMRLAKTLNKLAVLVGACDGFVGNRMLSPYLREAEFLLEEGAAPYRSTQSTFGDTK